jgi:deazaflavin-dependent oxidoreductase (nitroreductase family)
MESKMASTFRDTLMKSFRKLHTTLYHASGGKIGGSINGSPLLLLTVTGRKSGQAYIIPLAYVLHNGEYLISASAAGADKNPSWFSNLASKPAAKIEVNGKTYDVTATIATGEERDRLYELFKAQGSNFVEYEKKTTRIIPVIKLKPTTV